MNVKWPKGGSCTVMNIWLPRRTQVRKTHIVNETWSSFVTLKDFMFDCYYCLHLSVTLLLQAKSLKEFREQSLKKSREKYWNLRQAQGGTIFGNNHWKNSGVILKEFKEKSLKESQENLGRNLWKHLGRNSFKKPERNHQRKSRGNKWLNCGINFWRNPLDIPKGIRK